MSRRGMLSAPRAPRRKAASTGLAPFQTIIGMKWRETVVLTAKRRVVATRRTQKETVR